MAISDDFNRANGPLGSNWTISNGTLEILSNEAATAAAAYNLAFWNANVFSADQLSEAYIVTGSASFHGPAVRVSTGGNGYFAVCSGAGAGSYIELHKYVATVDTVLTTWTGITIVTGDIIHLDVSGTLLTVKQNGSLIGTFSDSTFATGQPGIFIFNTGCAIDLWVADGLAPSGDPPPLRPTGWINQGLLATLFAPEVIGVVNSFVMLPGDSVDQPPIQRSLSRQLAIQRSWVTDWPTQTRVVQNAALFAPQVIIGTPPLVGIRTALYTALVVQQWRQTWPAQRPRALVVAGPAPPPPPGPADACDTFTVQADVQPFIVPADLGGFTVPGCKS